jgi:hypothetical protein
VIDGVKVCPRCKQEKAELDYSPERFAHPQGFCRVCNNERRRAEREAALRRKQNAQR